jgi:DNA modification methylase
MTRTSAFGVGRREAHDAAAFYARFTPPRLSTDDTVRRADPTEALVCGDARRMDGVADASVALVVTSPPYFAGKEYEEALGHGAVPGTYLDYLAMLRDVFAECVRVLEPGGRLAVNVANLGRRPYRSLTADVVRVLQDDLGLLLRGEIVWVKARGASGSCAWGSFCSPANPVLRDLSERVVVASKGRFARAQAAVRRRDTGLPWVSTLTRDEFLEATLDVWEIPPESARRVGHPAPFPVALPQRLIELFTYRDDLVLDPFLGSGTTAVAAVRSGRRAAGYDTDPAYVASARQRVEAEQRRLGSAAPGAYERARAEGGSALAVAEAALTRAGFTSVAAKRRVPGTRLSADLSAVDRSGRRWWFEVVGGFTTVDAGLARTEAVWRALGRAGALERAGATPLVVLTTARPARGTEGEAALGAAIPRPVHDVVELLDDVGTARLGRLAAGDDAAPAAPGSPPPK